MLSYSLDDLIAQFSLPPPDHIKIDVDGTELEIIRGMPRTLEALKTILIEIDHAVPGHEEILSRIAAAGFSVVGKHPRTIPTDINYIFAKRHETPRRY
jgi:hypothetical protein